MPVKAALKIYFSVAERYHESKRARYLIRRIERCFTGSEVVYSERDEENEYRHFDTLVECAALVVLPSDLTLDTRQKWEIKMFFSLHRQVFVISPEDHILLVDEIEGIGVHPNSKLLRYE